MQCGDWTPERARRMLAEKLRPGPLAPDKPRRSRGHGPRVLLSIRPRFARLMVCGVKRVEFRRRFSPRYAGTQALFYVTRPVQAISFGATIVSVDRGAVAWLWDQFGTLSAVGRDEFDAYFEGCEEGVAIGIAMVRELEKPMELARGELKRMGFRPPQSYCAIGEELAKVLRG